MTAQEIIKKIRAEVNRLKEEHQEPTFRGDEYEEGGINGYHIALDKVLAKLDTLQEQPVELPITFQGDLAAPVPPTMTNPQDRLRFMEHWSNRHSKEQPVCEGVEEEILNSYDESLHERWTKCPYTIFQDIARHFAKWGAEHRGSSETPKDLESYAQKVEDHYDVGEERGYLCVHRGEVKDAVISGAKWQKEQMMKDCVHEVNQAYFRGIEVGRKEQKEQMMKEAVDAEVLDLGINYLDLSLFDAEKLGFAQGDEVKFIIVKED